MLVDVSSAQLNETATSLDFPGGQVPQTYRVNQVRVGYRTEPLLLVWEPFVRFTNDSYDEVPVQAGQANGRFRDRNTFGGGVVGRYQLAERRDIVVSAEGFGSNYLTTDPGFGSRDFVGATILAGLEYGAPAFYQFRVLAGVETRSFSNRALKGEDRPGRGGGGGGLAHPPHHLDGHADPPQSTTAATWPRKGSPTRRPDSRSIKKLATIFYCRATHRCKMRAISRTAGTRRSSAAAAEPPGSLTGTGGYRRPMITYIDLPIGSRPTTKASTCCGSGSDSNRAALSRRSALFGASLLSLTALGLSACSPGANLPELPGTDASGTYTLGAGDQVHILTFDEAQLTGDFRVNDSGDFDFPLIGKVPANGTTTEELSSAIRARLKAKGLLKDPNVSVAILAYRPVFVLGEVVRPGQYPFQPGMTVLTAVAVAGGFTYRAVEERMTVLRTINGHPTEGRVDRGRALQPGDVVTILERVV